MSQTDAIVARIMRIRNGMILDADAENIIRREIDALDAAKKPKRFRRIKCDECNQNYVDAKGEICPGCEAYREHTGHF